MAKTLNKVATVVGVIASIAAVIPGPWQPIAAIVAVAANVAATASSMAIRKPPALGNTTQILIGPNLPMPYAMGRTYVGGNLMLDVGYGATLNDVPNPYRSMVIVGAQGGPIDSFEAFQADFETITFSGAAATGYYGGFLWRATQLGATPEAAALAGPHGAIPGWGASYKLSGYAAWLVTMKFDRKGTVFASGVPQFGVIGKWAKVYDPRLDDTYTGGAGDHRFDDETTFEWSENPGLHGPTYARGRYQGDDDRKVIGCGFAKDAIDWPAWVAFANVCDANGWALGGTIFESPGQSKWDNLKRICAAGGAEPVFVGGLLSVRYPSPKTALDTITADDLADGDCVVPAMKGWKERKNGIVPRYRSEEHKWEYVQSDLVSVPAYVTEDGEEKNEERQFDLVQDKDQAAQLAAYELVDAREFGPIVLRCKPRLIEYKPGEALEVDIPELGLNEQLCVIKGRSIDPGTAIVTLTLESETTAKHAFALGLTGTAPPTPTITTGEEMDEVAGVQLTREAALLIANSSTRPTRVLSASESGGSATITVIEHERVYQDGSAVLIGEQVFTGLLTDTPYFPWYDDLSRSDTTPTIIMTTDSGEPQDVPGAHQLGRIRTPVTASGIVYEGGGAYMASATVGREVDGPIP